MVCQNGQAAEDGIDGGDTFLVGDGRSGLEVVAIGGGREERKREKSDVGVTSSGVEGGGRGKAERGSRTAKDFKVGIGWEPMPGSPHGLGRRKGKGREGLGLWLWLSAAMEEEARTVKAERKGFLQCHTRFSDLLS